MLSKNKLFQYFEYKGSKMTTIRGSPSKRDHTKPHIQQEAHIAGGKYYFTLIITGEITEARKSKSVQIH